MSRKDEPEKAENLVSIILEIAARAASRFRLVYFIFCAGMLAPPWLNVIPVVAPFASRVKVICTGASFEKKTVSDSAASANFD
jgi:hypothetical protein